MLKYEVKLGKDNFKRDELVWREKYLSPDLSYITGVTSPFYHLEKFDKLASTNSIIRTDGVVDLECENVKRQGYVIVEKKEYDVNKDSIVDYSIIKEGETKEYAYIKNKDKFFYWGQFPNDANISGYTIDNLLNYNEEESAIVETIQVECESGETPLKIDTVYWIEDGVVEIDGHKYFYDKNEGENGILKYGENGIALEPSAITRCRSIKFYPYKDASMYEEVTKFKLTRGEKQEESFDRITFARYYYYVKYKNHLCPIKQKFDGDDYQFVCEIPLYVISAKTEDRISSLATKEYPLYFVGEYGEDGASAQYEERYEEGYLVDKAHLEEHYVYNLNDLKNIDSFICIDDFEKAYFAVEYDVMNANEGNEIIVYLNNAYAPLNEGDEILFIDSTSLTHENEVYNSDNYNGTDEEYVIYNSKKYLVQKNLMDKVIINDNEYDIDYKISGKVENADCFVTINGEKVPMLIKSVDGGEYSSGTLQRYGKIVSGDSNSQKVVDMVYDIKPYDGIIVNGLKYIIYEVENEDASETYKYAVIDLPKEYTFIVNRKIGNSTYVCEPSINASEFTDEFNRMYSSIMCGEIVSNQRDYILYIDNKIFGEREITKELPFIRNLRPVSSDDYYNLFDDLKIYVNNGYIHIPISLRMSVANNMMQEDIVTRDFFEVEKRKRINPIVDMEKDVYYPKYINGYYEADGSVHYYGEGEDKMYSGSTTLFETIGKINLNLHFRTRNLDNWKVNDGDNLYSTSGDSDNWFITDFHPYCDILKNKKVESGDTLMNASDLIGLLYFTYDDVFYQRNKIAKSFVRLSFYDSTDPQTQSLLATSCIFMDEHALFKKCIDNSRKYINEYGTVSTPIFKKVDGYIQEPKEDVTSDKKEGFIYKLEKIGVNTEYLGALGENKKNNVKYEQYETDYVNVKVWDEAHRLSSRLVVDNKYKTDTSSEGFYAYIFREYSENLHPKPIYMKIEFNHAGIGKVIPFLIPMKWEKKEGTKTNKMFPTRSLQFKEEGDLEEMKKGYPLSYVYAQTYIPLYAVYDFVKKEYGYIFDERYVKIEDDGSLNLNVFEMKIMDESQVRVSDEERDDIKTNKQIKAVINVNPKQFDKKSFNYEVE